MIGSKGGSGVWQKIISEMPIHDTYIECFAGSGVIGLKKKPSRCTIFIDIDAAAPIFHRGTAKEVLPADEDKKYILYSPSLNHLIEIAGTHYVNADAIAQLATLDLSVHPAETTKAVLRYRRNILFYFDPPYPFYVRSFTGRYYKYEFGREEQHKILIDYCLNLAYAGYGVMISGYHCDIYDVAFSHWRHVDVPTVDRRGHKKIEVIWMSFPEPLEYNDVRWLGKNYRERDRIKKKVRRWSERIRTMSKIDRASIFSAVRDLEKEYYERT